MCAVVFFFVFKQKTAYEMRISDGSSDVCSSDLYDDALTLALESIRRRAVVPGVIKVATTSVGGDSGFARTLAGAIDIDKALAEGYRRNHAGNYADAAEFFAAPIGSA